LGQRDLVTDDQAERVLASLDQRHADPRAADDHPVELRPVERRAGQTLAQRRVALRTFGVPTRIEVHHLTSSITTRVPSTPTRMPTTIAIAQVFCVVAPGSWGAGSAFEGASSVTGAPSLL